MKKTLLLLFIIVISQTLFSQSIYTVQPTLFPDHYCVFLANESGFLTERTIYFCLHKITASNYNYLKQNNLLVKNGSSITYYPNLTVKSKTTYNDGMLNKRFISYFENGSIKSLYNFNNNRLTGKQESFDINGELINQIEIQGNTANFKQFKNTEEDKTSIDTAILKKLKSGLSNTKIPFGTGRINQIDFEIHISNNGDLQYIQFPNSYSDALKSNITHTIISLDLNYSNLKSPFENPMPTISVITNVKRRKIRTNDTRIDFTVDESFNINYQIAPTHFIDSNVAYNIDKKPFFAEGKPALYQFLTDSIDFPLIVAFEDNIITKAVVSFIVDINGRIIDPEMIVSGSSEIDREVIKVIKKLRKWNPAKRNHQPIPYPVRISFYFDPIEILAAGNIMIDE